MSLNKNEPVLSAAFAGTPVSRTNICGRFSWEIGFDETLAVGVIQWVSPPWLWHPRTKLNGCNKEFENVTILMVFLGRKLIGKVVESKQTTILSKENEMFFLVHER